MLEPADARPADGTRGNTGLFNRRLDGTGESGYTNWRPEMQLAH
jgi:hypothetical protein